VATLRRVREHYRTPLILILVWVALIVVTGATHPYFFSADTLRAITYNMILPGIVALGLAMVAISGGTLDLSVSSNVTGAALLTAVLSSAGLPLPVTLLAVLAFGLGVGAVNAFLVVGLGLSTLVATVASNFVLGGIVILEFAAMPLERVSIAPDSPLAAFGQASVLAVPVPLVVVLVLIVGAGFVLDRTAAGRRFTAVGGNKAAATTRGISVRWTRVTSLLLCGSLAALGGILFASQYAIVPQAPDPSLAYQSAAIVLLGGVSLAGGRGGMAGLAASLLLLSSLQTMLAFFGIQSQWQSVLSGAALIVAVSFDAYRTRGHRALRLLALFRVPDAPRARG
jgi:ribose/xylose/arabinose/galactoside ABC-type transport system permease subunit